MTSFQRRELLLRRARKGDNRALAEYEEAWHWRPSTSLTRTVMSGRQPRRP